MRPAGARKFKEAGHTLTSAADSEGRYLSAAQLWFLIGFADDRIQGIVTTGGTGFPGRDSTPEALAPLFDKTIEGFGELFRQLSVEDIGSSTIQSRCLAGLANRTVILLPARLQ